MVNAPALWKSFVVFLAPMMPINILQSPFGTINNVYLGILPAMIAACSAACAAGNG